MKETEFQKLFREYKQAGDNLLFCLKCSVSSEQCENRCTDKFTIAFTKFKKVPGGYGYEHRARILKGKNDESRV